MIEVNLRKLFAAGVHFGHLTRFRNPQMSQYIYGARDNISIINLEKTMPLLEEALQFVRRVISNDGRILFVGTKKSAGKVIREAAIRSGMPFVDYRWLGGMLTNYKTIKNSVRRLAELTKMKAEGAFDSLTKKERLNIDREMQKLEQSLGGVKDMPGLPDALFVIDVGYEHTAVREANRLKIPVVGIVDTNSSPINIDYPIPGNDDSMAAINLYAGIVADTILEAKADKSLNFKYAEDLADNTVEEKE